MWKREMSLEYDLVLNRGLIIDPDREIEFVGNVGIKNGVIQYLGSNDITGVKEIGIHQEKVNRVVIME